MKSKKRKHKRKSAQNDGGFSRSEEIDVKTVDVHTEGTLLLESSSMKKITAAQFLVFIFSAGLMALIVWLLPLPTWASVVIAAVPVFPLYGKLRRVLMIGAYLMPGKATTVSWMLAGEYALILDGRTIPFSHIRKISFMEGDEGRVFSPLSATIETKEGSFHFRTLRDGTEDEVEASKDSLNDFLVAMKLLTDIEMEML